MRNRMSGALLAILMSLVVTACSTQPPDPPQSEPSPISGAPVAQDPTVPAPNPGPAVPALDQDPPDEDAPDAEAPERSVTAPAEQAQLEAAVPELAAQPDLLLVLAEPEENRWEPTHEDVFGYYLDTHELVPLSSGDTRMIDSLTLSPGGEWFSYVRRVGPPMLEKPEAFCIRSTRGGAPRCYWFPGGSRPSYRPGTEEWFIRGDEDQGWLSVPASPAAPEQEPKPHPYLNTELSLSFSPDGKWAWYEGDGLWAVDLSVTNPTPRKIIDDAVSDVAWLGPERLVAAVGDKKWHTWYTNLYVVTLSTGEITDLGRPPGDQFILDGPKPDPTSRFLWVKYGSRLSVGDVYGGDAIYDLETGEWTADFPDSEGLAPHNRAMWTGDGSTLLMVEKNKKAYLYDPATGARSGERDLPERAFHSFSPDMRWTYMRQRQGEVHELHNLETGETHVLDTGDKRLVELHWLTTK